MIRNSFNYSILGDIVFKKLCIIVSDVEVYVIIYFDFDDIEFILYKIIRWSLILFFKKLLVFLKVFDLC